VTTRILDEDVVRVRGDLFDAFTGETKAGRVVRTLYWGDSIEFVDEADNASASVRDVRVRLYDYASGEHQEGFVRKRREDGANVPLRLRPPGAERLLEVTFVDVGSGDAALIRTPGGRHLLFDGGEESLVTRLLAATFPGTTAAKPLAIDALVVTHGDADHFAGLAALADAPAHPEPRKRIHARVARVYHNGLVMRPAKVDGKKLRDAERFGKKVAEGGEHYVTELYDDPRKAPVVNDGFARWNEALDSLLARNGAVVRRLAAGDHDAFDFLLGEDIEVRVLGPVTELVDGKPALRILRSADGAPSAQQTINGHALVVKLRFRNVRMLLGGDLTAAGAQRVLDFAAHQHPPISLESEIFKVPHHGASDFLPAFLEAVAPVASLVSCGIALEGHTYPRANVMAALGRASRSDAPLLFSVPLVSRFAAIHVRTDGRRVLLAPECAPGQLREAYAWKVDAAGAVTRDAWGIV
jgi:hypothetical protein